MKGFWKDFKAFITKGSVIDLAVAVVIGNAFSAIVTAFVDNIITPLLSLLLNKVSFQELSVKLSSGSLLTYGVFIQKIIDFLIIAFSIFLALRIIMGIKKHREKLALKFKTLQAKSELTKKESKFFKRYYKRKEKELLKLKEEEEKQKLLQEEEKLKAKEQAQLDADNAPLTHADKLLMEIKELLVKENGKGKTE